MACGFRVQRRYKDFCWLEILNGHNLRAERIDQGINNDPYEYGARAARNLSVSRARDALQAREKFQDTRSKNVENVWCFIFPGPFCCLPKFAAAYMLFKLFGIWVSGISRLPKFLQV